MTKQSPIDYQIPLFEQFNGLAHKRKTINVGHPAIIWHQAYWKPNIPENLWHRDIDQYLLETHRIFSEFSENKYCDVSISGGVKELTAIPPRFVNYSAENYQPDLSASYFHLRKDGLKISVAIEKFDEFWSSKLIMDFSHVDEHCDSIDEWLVPLHKGLVEAEKIVVSRFNEINKKANQSTNTDDDSKSVEIVDNIESADTAQHAASSDSAERTEKVGTGSNENSKSAERTSLDERTAEISSAISLALYESKKKLLPSMSQSGRYDITSPEFQFVNFVGISLGINVGQRNEGKNEADKNKNKMAVRFTAVETNGIIDNLLPRRAFNSSNIGDISTLVEAVWPLVKGINPYFKYDEGTFVKPNGETAKQILELFNAEKREFTTSLLNRARSMYVTSLGGIRHEEKKGIAFPLSYLLISPHRATWQIGRIIDRIHSLGLFRLATFQDYEKIEFANDKLSELGKSINDPDKETDDITRQFLALLKLTPDGLMNRIEWSRYYLELFKETLSYLNFKRVEGYQTYREFVSRRLSTRFSTIEDAGNRVEALSRQIRARTAEDTGHSIEELLEFAENVSIIPISYYLHHVIFFANSLLLEYIPSCLHLPIPIEFVWILASLIYIRWVREVRPLSRIRGKRKLRQS